MAQEKVWEDEYRKSKLLTKENKPQADTIRFVEYLKENNVDISAAKVLDLGSGTGRNSFYFAELDLNQSEGLIGRTGSPVLGAKVLGLEISKTAIEIAENNAKEAGLNIEYKKQSIGEKFPCEDDSVDIVLDVTSSNSLTEVEREVYLSETHRVLKNGGYFFVKALCKDGDKNAKYLIKNFPGKEKDTYIMPELGVTERIWTKEDFMETYSKYFTILNLEKKTSYSRMNNRSYKRNFWIVYLKKE